VHAALASTLLLFPSSLVDEEDDEAAGWDDGPGWEALPG